MKFLFYSRSENKMKKQRDGYLLLMVLVMLTIAGLLTAGVARRSMGQAVACVQMKSELQRRWGSAACRRAILDRAEILLRKQEQRAEEDVRPLPRIERTFKLGDIEFEILLSDEQAKLNLNRVFAEKQLQGVDRALYQTVDGLSTYLVPEPTPHPAALPNVSFPPAFSSWGQVFSYEQSRVPGTTAQLPLAIANSTSEITCWGNGRLNLHRSSTETLNRLCCLVAGPEVAKNVLESRITAPYLKVEKLLKSVDLNRKETRKLRRCLIDRSTCHSLWIIMREDFQQKIRLEIKQEGIQPEIVRFSW